MGNLIAGIIKFTKSICHLVQMNLNNCKIVKLLKIVLFIKELGTAIPVEILKKVELITILDLPKVAIVQSATIAFEVLTTIVFY